MAPREAPAGNTRRRTADEDNDAARFEELSAYLEQATDEYMAMPAREMWYAFATDVDEYKDLLNQVSRFLLRQVARVLRQRGVFVPMTTRRAMHDVLIDLINREEPPTWPEDEPKEILTNDPQNRHARML